MGAKPTPAQRRALEAAISRSWSTGKVFAGDCHPNTARALIACGWVEVEVWRAVAIQSDRPGSRPRGYVCDYRLRVTPEGRAAIKED